MTRWLTGALLLCASVVAAACPLCIGAFRQSPAQELTSLRQAVLAVPTADRSGYRVVEVIKGEPPPNGMIEEGSFQADAAALRSAKPLLLVRDASWPMWVNVGTIGAEHAGWLRQLAAGKRWTDMNADEWRARVALMLPYLENPEPLVAEIAYAEFASAPYAALLDDESASRRRRDPALDRRSAARRATVALPSAAGDRRRRHGTPLASNSRLDAAWKVRRRDEPRLACSPPTWSCAARLANGVDRREVSCAIASASTPEIEAALLALSACRAMRATRSRASG